MAWRGLFDVPLIKAMVMVINSAIGIMAPSRLP
jgi:hypothetical protein